MKFLSNLVKVIAKERIEPHKLAYIEDIPTEQFNALIEALRADRWRKKYEYSGFDAWIDYGCVKLKKNSVTLKLEWNNWTEGRIEGPEDVIESVGRDFGLIQTSKA